MKFFKHSLLLATVVFNTAAFYCVAINGWQAENTISVHIASSLDAIMCFSIVNTVSVILIMIGLYFIARKWEFGIEYKIPVVILAVCMLAVSWFPHSSGIIADIHVIMAWIMMFSMALSVLVAYINSFYKANLAVKISGAVYLLFTAYLGVSFLFFGSFFFANVLLLEFLYFNAMFGFMMILNYSDPKSDKIIE